LIDIEDSDDEDTIVVLSKHEPPPAVPALVATLFTTILDITPSKKLPPPAPLTLPSTTIPDITPSKQYYTYFDEMPAAYADYKFVLELNPKTRTRTFAHLKGAALYDAIEDLPPWQQTQELIP
jgi:hypothetical protein